MIYHKIFQFFQFEYLSSQETHSYVLDKKKDGNAICTVSKLKQKPRNMRMTESDKE